MRRIATLTLNPAIDGACEAERVFPTHKIRTNNERYDPGGGGINVARVVARLGGEAEAYYLAGGVTGAVLDSLIDKAGIARTRIDIHDHTRVSLAVHERASGQEFRFVPEGPLVGDAEWQAALDRLTVAECDYLVVSGSLPRGVPDDFYARARAAMAPRGVKLVVDTSGAALARTLVDGGIFLMKPSQGELEQLIGRKLADVAAIAEAASAFVAGGQVEHVAVTMGHRGAVLVNAGGAFLLPAVPVAARSAVGAGDSFVGAMTLGFARGWSAAEAFRYGLAAGTAAVLTPGTDLCCREDVERILASVPEPEALTIGASAG